MTQQVWSNPPLYYSLAQLVFNEIPNLDQHISEIADYLRLSKFTDYQPIEIDSVQFSIEQGSEAKIQTVKQKQWNFFNKEKKSVFSLSTNTLVFATTEYKERNDFVEKVLKGIEAINLTGKLDFIDRIGVRHIDLVIPSANKNACEYISLGLHGISTENSLKRVSQTTEGVYTNDLCWVICRNTLREFPAGLINPESFMGLIQLNVNSKFNLPSNQEIACIDIDSFIQHRIDFDLQSIKDNLVNLRAFMEPILKSSITELALGEWK
jgi:uncharacterized protein (TIGR04255 family)